MVFCSAFMVGALMYIRIALTYIGQGYTNASSYPADLNGCVFGHDVCAYMNYDPYTFVLVLYTIVQTIWVSFVFVTQIIQICWARTTNEAINFQRYLYLINPEDHGLPPYQRRILNPFDFGPIGNCVEFWSGGTGGKLKYVDWTTIYDVPPSLMKDAIRRNGLYDA